MVLGKKWKDRQSVGYIYRLELNTWRQAKAVIYGTTGC
jgi:hypothetical protein